MQNRVKADLARRGLTSSNLAGLESEDEYDGDIIRFALKVHLKGGLEQLVYTMDNADGAELRCNGELVPLFDAVN